VPVSLIFMLRMKRLLIAVFYFTLVNPVFALSVSLQDETGPLPDNDSAEVWRYFTQAKEIMADHPEDALLLLDEAEIHSVRSEKKYLIGDIYTLKGNVFCSMQDNASALKNFHTASIWYKKQQDSISVAGIYVNISRVCNESGDTAGHELYLKLADKICPTHSKAGLKVKSLIQLNSGVVNFKKGRYEKALEYFIRCLEISRQVKVKNVSLVFNNLAMVYSKLDQDDIATIYADSALECAHQENDSYFLSIAYSTRGDMMVKQKNYAKAITFYEKSMSYGKKYSYYGNITVSLYRDLYLCYYHLGDYRNALKYHVQYMEHNDSAYSIEKIKQINEVEARYKLEQKNATIAHLNRQNILKSELASRQQMIIIAVVLALFLLAALMFLFVRYNRKIRRLNGLLREKSKRITEQNKCIEAQKALLQKEASKLEHENTIAHFEILKNQVNPHMLFNALAVLKSIIDKDKNDAKSFIDDLSNVFRHALELKSNLLVKLDEELSFVESYINIITKQYEDCFSCNISVPDVAKNYYIPPFSLQLIVENVIKHNELSEEDPVHMEISYRDETIQIDNTRARMRKSKSRPMGIGHHYLINRYKLVSEKAPLFISDETFFSVRLPLFIDE